MLRVALAQINVTVGDFEGNKKKILDALKQARASGSDIVAFPPMSVCGYPPGGLLIRNSFLRSCRRTLEDIARQTKGIIAIVGFADREQESSLGAAAVLHQGRIAAVAGARDQYPLFSLGEEVFTVILGSENSEKHYFGKHLPRTAGGPAVIFYLLASPYYPGEVENRERFLAVQAKKNAAVVAGCALVGGQDELVFPGGSMTLDRRGRVIARARLFSEDWLILDVNLRKLRETRRKNRLSAHRLERTVRPGKEATLIKLSLPGKNRRGPRSRVRKKKTKELSRVGEIYQALVLGTRDYVRKNDFTRVILGLSGGIDSSLTACIAVDALGAENVLGLSMPSRYSSGKNLKDTQRLADNLGINLITVPIDRIFQLYLDILTPQFGNRGPDVTEENLQARVRGNILMAFANKFGWLVLSTGNKSEASTGYCTLYGDMVGGFAVLKDIPKLMVYRLAAHYNRRSRKKVIPETIIKRIPTAELKPGQKDEDSLPPYPLLDPILAAYVDHGKDYREIVALGYPAGVVKKVIRMWRQAEFKRRQAPPGIRISPAAEEKKRSFPISSKFKGF